MEWTLADLVDRVAAALSSGYGGQPSGRVSDLPDIRVIRYYTTLGMVDRPGAMRGRTALYGERHLWQLVAIKRLQAEGHTLAAIQHRLAGASDARLRRLADVPDEAFWRRRPATAHAATDPDGAGATAGRSTARTATDPGAAHPATDPGAAHPAAGPSAAHAQPDSDAAHAQSNPDADRAFTGPDADRAFTDPDGGPAGVTYQAVPLGGGAIVLVPHRAPLTGRDLDALRAAAGPLDAALARLTEGAP